MGYEDDDGNERQRSKPTHKANVNSEFLRHPESGGFFRNPLCRRTGLLPVLLTEGEYKHNCLDEALKNCPCIKISEANFRKLVDDDAASTLCGSTTTSLRSSITASSRPETAPSPSSSSFSTPRSTPSSARSMHRRVQLNRLPEVSSVGCDIVVNLFVPPSENHHHHKPHEPPKEAKSNAKQRVQQEGMERRPPKDLMLDNMMIDVNGLESSHLQVARIRDGVISQWNRKHPELQVRVGDHIVRVNGHKKGPADLASELAAASGNVTVVMRRPATVPPPQRR